jgi:chromosomal replication initiation ATPase DnaA
MNTQESRMVDVKVPARIQLMQDANLNGISIAQMIDPLTQSEVARLEERVIGLEKSLARATSFLDDFTSYKEVTQSLAVELGLLHKTGFFKGKINKDPITIVAAIASAFGLSTKQIMSKRRPDSIAVPRMAAMYIMRTTLGMTLEGIGEFFKRDHATAMHAIKRIAFFLSHKNAKKQIIGMSQSIFKGKIKAVQEQFEVSEI